ncbi:MAG: saccharopine dehydrogenase NADP-binding domain-containing protein [Anaerolineae bacterium]|nr:saccharopine dehydrogenase NADP-binding domain-containing protein [Anaerolineae bacterium]MDW8171922.1 saccharopine dehydrogenase NADP-binding domain-containing protein [Anaerolineae bacterium]
MDDANSMSKTDSPRWLLYGATGYTGVLVAERAVELGYPPILAGRNADLLKPLAARLGLEYRAFPLDDVNEIARQIADVQIVYHAAGPFIHTSDPMIRACLATRVHYLDITGELAVFENTFRYDDAARKIGIALISGVGFDVIPTESLAYYVAAQVPGAQHLELALRAFGLRVSAGTLKSFMEMLPQGAQVRRQGRLESQPLGAGARRFVFAEGEEPTPALPISWGDLITAYRSTGVPNITVYLASPTLVIALARIGGPAISLALCSGVLRRAAGRLIDAVARGPSASKRQSDHVVILASASDATGTRKTARLVMPEGYQFTAWVALPVILRTLELRPVGALTPVMAFGPDFVLEIEGVQRQDDVAWV